MGLLRKRLGLLENEGSIRAEADPSLVLGMTAHCGFGHPERSEGSAGPSTDGNLPRCDS
jgi:hypothetical protein